MLIRRRIWSLLSCTVRNRFMADRLAPLLAGLSPVWPVFDGGLSPEGMSRHAQFFHRSNNKRNLTCLATDTHFDYRDNRDALIRT